MALTFGAGATDRVAVGNAASITNLTTVTVCGWIYPTTLTSLRVITGSRYDASGQSGIRFRLNGTTGNLDLTVKQGTSDAQYITNDNACPVNTDTFFAFTYDQGATPRIHIYHGSLTAILAESTYGTSNDGTGTKTTDSSGQWLIGDGNAGSSPASAAFQGRISNFQIYNVVLSLAELRGLQFGAAPIRSGRVGYWELGYNGVSTQPDWSGNGNAGTVTGATQSQHVPLGPMFGRSPMAVPYVVAAAASSKLFRPSMLAGLGSGGPFFQSPLN